MAFKIMNSVGPSVCTELAAAGSWILRAAYLCRTLWAANRCRTSVGSAPMSHIYVVERGMRHDRDSTRIPHSGERKPEDKKTRVGLFFYRCSRMMLSKHTWFAHPCEGRVVHLGQIIHSYLDLSGQIYS